MSVLDLQQAGFDRLVALKSRLPHALLLHGPGGIGKSALARAYAAALLCQQPDAAARACGRCGACRLLEQGAHPDFRVLEPEAAQETEADEAATGSGEEGAKKTDAKRSRLITVSQVRALQDKLHVGSHQGGLSVVVVDPADAMNVSTANALLKTLEEPSPGILFILVVSSVHRLLPTVVSRTMQVAIQPPPAQAAAAWLAAQGVPQAARLLAHSGGLPALAARWGEEGPGLLDRIEADLSGQGGFDALACAEFWDRRLAAVQKSARAGLDAETLVSWVQRWMHDLLCVLAGLPPRFHVDGAERLQTAAAQAGRHEALRYARELHEFRRLARHTLNTRLFLEELFLRYSAILVR